jgi:TATA-binding protein-associated factor Taf7
MRSSNWEEARNFHFLMIVQMIAVPATQAAMTMSTVIVRESLTDDDGGVDDAVADASDASVVIVTFAIDAGVVAWDEEATTVGAWEVITGEALDDDDDDEEEEEEEEEEDTKDIAPETELLVGVIGFVRELRIPLSRGLLAEADG